MPVSGTVSCSAAGSSHPGVTTSDSVVYDSFAYTTNSTSVEERGATVEGGKSDQVFGSTVWLGDAPNTQTKFVFNLRCRTVEQDAEFREYLRLKAKFG
jgi:hypothetical protein